MGREEIESAMHLPWVEKYRPKSVQDIAHQEEVVKTLSSSIQSGILPHLLFYGPPGTGKTSTILAVARSLYGHDFRKTGRVMELNASDERGISVVRNKIKTFAQGAIRADAHMPPFKLIILDEADSMTSDAQAALRRMIEKYSKVTRFCLICNYVTRVIKPVVSRCAKFRFKPLTLESMRSKLCEIAAQEMIDCPNDVIAAILDHSEGDMRRAINYLQTATQLNGTKITPQTIHEIAGSVPRNAMESFWKVLRENNFERMKNQVDELIAMGYPVLSMLHQLLRQILQDATLNDVQKGTMSLRLAEADKKMIDGASEYLQFMDVSALILRTYAMAEGATLA